MKKPEPWQSLQASFEPFLSLFDNYQDISITEFYHLQPRLMASIESFQRSMHTMMLINMPDNLVYRNLLKDAFDAQGAVHVLTSESIKIEDYLGQYQVQGADIHEIKGLFELADQGLLIIPANLILANPKDWPLIKSILNQQAYQALACDPKRIYPSPADKKSQFKLVITGDRDQLADLELIDDGLRPPVAMFAEIELEYRFNQNNSSLYLGYLKKLTQEMGFSAFADKPSLAAFLNQGTRQTEDQFYLPLSPLWHKYILNEVKQLSTNTVIHKAVIEKAIQKQNYYHEYLPKRALEDILDGQVIIETQGQRIGQVNGLTVVEVTGHPTSYGEPARISCVVHLGDGDISDVEHKTELGGNLHAKGMMIMQAFLTSALDLEEPLPFAASIVFEQSYSEVDGDSASLAELTALVSALSNIPVNQHVAVTGAVDQFGRVQAVGGLNEKIEGFFNICKHQGFNQKQGVVLPKANLRHLSLNPEVMQAIQDGQFHLWSVDSVDDAIPLLLNQVFRHEEDNHECDSCVLDEIAKRIQHLHKDEHTHENWFYRLKNKLFQH